MRRECIIFVVALTLQFTAGQLDLSFIDPFYHLYNLQHSQTFNNFATLSNNNNNNQQIYDNFVQEPLAGCIAASNSLQGTCLQGHECKYSRGVSTGRGNCTFSHNCCTYTKSCNDTVRARVVYFNNPTDPRTGPSPCSLRLQLLNRDICQLRVDIMQLALQGHLPGASMMTSGPCREYITVDPAPILPIPRICGSNSDTHFYVHLNQNNANDGIVNINMILGHLSNSMNSADFPTQASWNLRITQLECPGRKDTNTKHKKRNEDQAADDFGELAPAGCTQYHTQPTGIFKTFGFNNYFPAGQRYACCFKRFPYTCGVAFSNGMGECTLTTLLVPSPIPSNPPTYCPLAVPPTPFASVHEGPLYVEVDTEPATAGNIGPSMGFSFNYDLTQGCATT